MDVNGSVTIDLKPIELDYYCDISSIPLCRICLEKCQPNKSMCNIFTTTKQYSFSAMIMSCASVQLSENDGLPNMICESCIAKLDIAWEFKVQCENSDLKLRQLYANQQMEAQQTIDSFNMGMRTDDYFTVKANDGFMANIPHIDDIPTQDITEENAHCHDNDLVQTKTKNRSRTKPSKQKEPKVHQCDTCGKIFNRREYLTQHIRIHTGEKPYKCHLCDRRFVNSGHLTTHMRTHTGEKPHSCSLCPKAFSTRQELQKHTMVPKAVHNGERPFQCKMCGKTFGSSSNLYSHLRHHTGEKNFTCEHCGKAFYTKQELKQHIVVHTGEKAFLCSFCDKRFSQLAHLRRHMKLHKT